MRNSDRGLCFKDRLVLWALLLLLLSDRSHAVIPAAEEFRRLFRLLSAAKSLVVSEVVVGNTLSLRMQERATLWGVFCCRWFGLFSTVLS